MSTTTFKQPSKKSLDDVLGILVQEPADLYHSKAADYLSSHALADFRKCPLLFHRKRCGLVPDEDRPAYLVGRAAHTVILEGLDAFQESFAVGGPVNPKTGRSYGSTTKAWAEWAAAQQKEVLTNQQYSLVMQMANGVAQHDFAQELLSEGVAELPALEPFMDDMPSPQWTPSDVMLKGTAARILFGDPALIVSEPFTKPPFDVSLAVIDSDQLIITATLTNTKLKSEYTDTYHADLASNKQLFNDRALIIVDLPDGWEDVERVNVMSVRLGEHESPHRLVGHVVEEDDDVRRLHVQVDVPTTGYMQSRFRQSSATVVLKASR